MKYSKARFVVCEHRRIHGNISLCFKNFAALRRKSLVWHFVLCLFSCSKLSLSLLARNVFFHIHRHIVNTLWIFMPDLPFVSKKRKKTNDIASFHLPVILPMNILNTRYQMLLLFQCLRKSSKVTTTIECHVINRKEQRKTGCVFVILCNFFVFLFEILLTG